MNNEPNWQPISQLNLISNMIYNITKDTEQFNETMLKAKQRPYSLDDYTVERIINNYTESKEYILLYKKQLEKWKVEEKLTAAQELTIDNTYKVLKKCYKLTKNILKIADYVKKHTINSIMEKDDAELGLEYLFGMFGNDEV